MEETVSKIYEYLATYGFSILAAILIVLVGRWLSKIASKLIGKAMIKAGLDKTLAKFVQSLSYILLLIFVAIASLAKLGIQTASLIAVIGASGLAIGLALQGSLANFAAGVLLMIFKPYKVGDFVQIDDSTGTVKDIQIFNTIIDTLDNIRIIIPNAKVTDGMIMNYTSNGTRRVDLTVGVSYGDDLHKAKSVIENVLADDKRVLKEPAPTVAVCELGNSSVNFAVRPWCRCENYWDVYFDITRKVKLSLDENNITIPFPQRDVHIKSGKQEEVVGVAEKAQKRS
jgi:small conductance mechanosensitive channel